MHWLTGARQFLHALWCQSRWQPFGPSPGWNLQDGSLPRLAVGADFWLDAQLGSLSRALGFSCMWSLRVVWISPSMVALPRGRKLKPPDLLRPGLRGCRISLSLHPVIQSSHQASLNSRIKKINSSSQWERSIHLGTERISGVNGWKPFPNHAR